MEEGVLAHIRGGKGFSCEVGDPIKELVIMSRDEASLLSFQCMADLEGIISAVTVRMQV